MVQTKSFIAEHFNKRKQKIQNKMARAALPGARLKGGEMVMTATNKQRLGDRLLLKSSKMKLDVERLVKESQSQP
jgi:hypothetical protein